jgi:hypothetical protein
MRVECEHGSPSLNNHSDDKMCYSCAKRQDGTIDLKVLYVPQVFKIVKTGALELMMVYEKKCAIL